MQKLSRAELRMWMATDGVMGDPDGFGKRQDPFSAVAAVVAGTASTATVIAAVGEVGLAIGAVGAVTGSKDLMKVGGVLGLASGIGSIANSAFGAAEAASAGVASSAADAVGSDWATGAIDNVGSDWASGATSAMDSGLAASSMDAFSGAATAPLDEVNNGLFDADTASQNVADGTAASTGGKQVGQDVTGSQISGDSATASPAFSDARYNAQNAIDPSWTSPNSATDSVAGNSYFDRLKTYLKTDNGLNTTMQLGSAALSGIGKAYSDNRTFQLNQDLVNLKKKQQELGNEQVRVAGIINQARA